MKTRIPSLDGFRAISIVLVVFCHSRFLNGFPEYLFDFARQCDIGVTIFFVISGYLITKILQHEYQAAASINIKLFFVKRALRILPVFCLYFLFILFVNQKLNLGVNASNFIHALTFTTNFDSSPNWYLGHFWSLSIEEQFYIFWPLLIILFQKKLRLIIIFFIAYSCIIRVVHYKFNLNTGFYGFFSKSDPIMVGALAALSNIQNSMLFQKKSSINYSFQLIALVLIIFFTYCSAHGRFGIMALPFGNVIIACAIMYIILSYTTYKNNYFFRLLNSRLFIHLGLLSYSIYIWQQFFIFQGISLLNGPLYKLATIYLVSLISYNFWEKPFLKIKQLLTKKYVLAKKPILKTLL
ncbi:acyltransferase [Pedobacter sp.]|uniref:acyltransferase family protein n=1 Tax=Pedobacter sp. TaxID=1411316 RepID=UPI0031E365DC